MGRHQVEHFAQILAHRRWQTPLLQESVHGLPGITIYHHASEERPNGFSPLLLLDEALAGRNGARRLAAEQGVANSVGTSGLRPAHEWPLFAPSLAGAAFTPHTQHLLSQMVARSLLPHYTAEDLLRIINTIIEEEESSDAWKHHPAPGSRNSVSGRRF